MKKLKLKLAALLALGLVVPSLSGCTINLVEKELDDVVIDNPNKKPDDGEGEQGDKPVTTPTVNSISLNKQNLNMNVGETGTVTATVSVSNGAATTVTWSIDNSCVSITPDGNYCSFRAVSPGTSKITATSTADSTKKAVLTITVSDSDAGEGFDDSWLDEGFEYSDGFPIEKIEEFLGEGSYEIIEPSTMESNTYWCEVPAEEDSAATFVVITDGIIYEDYADDLLEAGFGKVFFDEQFYGYEAIDPTNTYTVVAYASMDEDTYEDIAPTWFQFYKTEDVWNDDTLTTDTEWNLDHIGEDSEDFVYEIEEVITKLPFIAMGQYYEINYNDNSWYSMFEVDIPNEVVINDYSYDDSILYDYDTILMDAGFEEFFDEEYQEYYYEGVVDGLLLTVSYYFGSLGNTISVMVEDAPLSAWPSAELAEFIETYIGSKYSIPDYEETEGAKFSWSFNEYYVSEDSDETIMVAEPTVLYAELDDMIAYGEKLEAAGFEYEYYPETDTDYPSIYATKGKIILTAYLEQVYVKDSGEYLDEGSIYFQIYGDETALEETGVFFAKDEINLPVNGTYTISLLRNDVPQTAEVNFISDDSDVAIVENGVITGVAIGSCEISLTCSYGGIDYTDSMTVNVVGETSFDEINAEIADYFEENGIEDTLELPALQCGETDAYVDDEYGCFSIECYDPTISLEEYLEILENEGFEIEEDEDYLDSYYVYGDSDSYIINIYLTDIGMIEIDIYVEEQATDSNLIIFNEIFSADTELDGKTFTTASGFEVTFSKAGGSSAPKYYTSNDGQARCYANNTVVITAPEGMILTSIEIVCTFEKNGYFSADSGELNKIQEGYQWDGETNCLTLTVSSSGQVRINSISISGVSAPNLEEFKQQVFGCLETLGLRIEYIDGYAEVISETDSFEELYDKILNVLSPLEPYELERPEDFTIEDSSGLYLDGSYIFLIELTGFHVEPEYNSIEVHVYFAEE